MLLSHMSLLQICQSLPPRFAEKEWKRKISKRRGMKLGWFIPMKISAPFCGWLKYTFTTVFNVRQLAKAKQFSSNLVIEKAFF